VADPKKPSVETWIEELHKEVLGMRFRVKRTLMSERSDFQKIDIVDTVGFGKMLFNDRVAMISERDEFVYHEMISHVPLFVKPDVERVLVIGGGDGGTAREVIRHGSVAHCRLVEIDALVVEGCKEHIPQTSAALDDPRVQVTIADGVDFVARTKERYDLVIVDSTDPIGPATPLFGEAFYAGVHRVLNDAGIVISQAESPFYYPEQQSSLLRILGRLFTRVHLYNYVNLTYPGGLWSFSYATKNGLCPLGGFADRRVAESGLDFRYYNAATHRAAFVLPEFQTRQLEGLTTPFD
jgi:spermidine synthase